VVNEEARREAARAEAEANEVFGRLAEVVQGLAERADEIDVLEVAQEVGLEIDEALLEQLQIDRFIIPNPWLPWHIWFPWRPWWCWWWRRHYPRYRCCPWWWYSCYWHRVA
jgi:hypothetical protein